ncbi:MAG TPA: hypothetical protein VHF26_19495, partial [Trebonia sp.]|nr:hypothetical protein [Trebonia sp.]
DQPRPRAEEKPAQTAEQQAAARRAFAAEVSAFSLGTGSRGTRGAPGTPGAPGPAGDAASGPAREKEVQS